MAEADPERHVPAVRRFNRFYTKKIGVLNEGLLESPFSLTEGRVLYELAHRDKPVATQLREELGLDAGYLSRLLTAFQKRGLVARSRSETDGRLSLLSLTEGGLEAFAALDARATAEVQRMLAALSASEKGRLVEAMQSIEGLLGTREPESTSWVLRPHQSGDMGWVVHRHGALYAQEYGWDDQFEALVADIVAGFLRRYDPKRERCWIAEKDGVNVGSVFLVQRSKRVAQLRLLLVEPNARGLGIGTRLVSECVRFARLAGYRKITLWTNDVLHAARNLYERAGFCLTHEEAHRSFGHDLVGQTFDMTL